MTELKTGATIMFTEPVWSQFEIPDPNVGLLHRVKSKVLGKRRIAARILKSTTAMVEIEVLDSDGTIRSSSVRSSGGRNPRSIQRTGWSDSPMKPIRRTRLAELEDEIAALRVRVQAEAEQHEAELAQALERFERRLVALERHSRSASTTVDIQPRLAFNRGHEE